MVGVLKLRVVIMLVGVLREKFFDILIYVYIYDTVCAGVVFMLAVV